MTSESLRDRMASVRQRLHEELDVQFESVASAHEQAVAAARENAEAAAEARWSALLTDARRQLQQDIENAVGAARAEFDEERSEAVRRRGILVQAVRDLDHTSGLTETLAAIHRLARGCASRIDLLITHGAEFRDWAGGSERPDSIPPIVRDAVEQRATISREDARAVPLLLDGVAVAVLYGEGSPSPVDADALELIGRVGALRLAYLTAHRLTQVQRWMETPSWIGPTRAASAASEEDASPIGDEVGARRFARLLISEIRMYNDSAVRAGRERRDLLHRLHPEIERVRRLYEARVGASLPMRDRYFDEELVRTLADGDRALLG